MIDSPNLLARICFKSLMCTTVLLTSLLSFNDDVSSSSLKGEPPVDSEVERISLRGPISLTRSPTRLPTRLDQGIAVSSFAPWTDAAYPLKAFSDCLG
jgi:hypothetical protein